VNNEKLLALLLITLVISVNPASQIIYGNRNLLKARMYLGLGYMWRAVRIHHGLKVWPPPDSNTLTNLEVKNILHHYLYGYSLHYTRFMIKSTP
jgi:hypothetical protein